MATPSPCPYGWCRSRAVTPSRREVVVQGEAHPQQPEGDGAGQHLPRQGVVGVDCLRGHRRGALDSAGSHRVRTAIKGKYRIVYILAYRLPVMDRQAAQEVRRARGNQGHAELSEPMSDSGRPRFRVSGPTFDAGAARWHLQRSTSGCSAGSSPARRARGYPPATAGGVGRYCVRPTARWIELQYEPTIGHRCGPWPMASSRRRRTSTSGSMISRPGSPGPRRPERARARTNRNPT